MASILIAAQDKYTDTLRKMEKATDGLDKSSEELERRLAELSKTKANLRAAAEKTRGELRKAEKQFAATGEAADQRTMEAYAESYDELNRKVKAVNQTMARTEKQIQRLESGRAGKSSLSQRLGDIGTALATQGLGEMAGQLAQNALTASVSSALGGTAGSLVGGMLSSAVTGGSIGMTAGGPMGAAIGAAAGAAVGAATAGLEVLQSRDEAFKSYVNSAVQEQISAMESTLSAGQSLAAGRETTQTAFSRLLGGDGKAERFLGQVLEFANTTPFLYDDLTAISKVLLSFGYSMEEILPTLTKVGDAGAALGLSADDIATVATYLGRMKASDKATLEYLNPLSERGFDVFGWLAERSGIDQSTLYDRISRGEVSGTAAVTEILERFGQYAGMMEEQSRTTEGLNSTLEGLHQNLSAAMGTGYNTARKEGLSAQIAWLGGETGAQMQEAYEAIGAWQADLENKKDQFIRSAVEGAMEQDEYTAAKLAGDGAEMGRIIMEAQIRGMNEYNASEGAQLALEAELALYDGVRSDTTGLEDAWNRGWRIAQEESKGYLAGLSGSRAVKGATADDMALDPTAYGRSHAFGLKRVPFDGYTATLHEGERVLTAQQARQQDGGSRQVIITGNTFHVREEADIERIAQSLMVMGQMRQRAGVF